VNRNRDLSLAELASVININPTYFANLFKQAMGISPHQFAETNGGYDAFFKKFNDDRIPTTSSHHNNCNKQ
jgi:methylphosphotriester-DNA--protein-cysteine methyltransferase